MENRKNTYTVYFFLVFILCCSAFLFDVANMGRWPMEHSFRMRALPMFTSSFSLGLGNAIWRLLAWGGMGFLGLHLSFKTNFIREILNDDIKRPKIMIITVLIGIIIGLFFIVYNDIYTGAVSLHGLLLHRRAEFPSSLFTSLAEGIGDRILNMFRVVFLMWLFSKVIKSEKGRTVLFGFVAVLSAFIFVLEHIPYTTIFARMPGLFNRPSIFSLTPSDYMWIVGLYAPLSLVCTFFLKKYGPLSAITIHFVCDFTWRVVWAS